MTTVQKQSEEFRLEAYSIALNNVNSQNQIAQAMNDIGYDKPIIDVGRNLLKDTLEKYQVKQAENAERSHAYDTFYAMWLEMDKQYTSDRKKVKIIFKSEPAILLRLVIVGSPPKPFEEWLQTVKIFYTELSKDEELQKRAQRLRLCKEGIMIARKNVEELELARANYIEEKGEAQNATQVKDDAFIKIDEWMSDFYAVARIALEENPQLLESLRKTVKN